MISLIELTACISYGAAVILAARNNIHTWWLTILGCTLYAWVFYDAKLYGEVTLQGFFLLTSIAGWINWYKNNQSHQGQSSIRHISAKQAIFLIFFSFAIAASYATILHRFTDAWSPLPDSAILAFSMIAQFLLIGRRLETWYAWLMADTLAIPLFATRGLYLTAALYLFFWCNAWYGLYRWRKELTSQH